MKKRHVLIWVIWGAIPLCCAVFPAFRPWNTFAGLSIAQNTTPKPADTAPGFWQKIKSSLHKNEAEPSSGPKSVTEQYELLYDWIHHDEIKFYDSLSRIGVSDWDRYQNIVTLKYRKSELQLAPNIKVFGWHPYWMGNAYESYNFKLLSYIAWFSYNIDPKTGSYDNPDVIDAWKKADPLIQSAHAAKCKVLITITSHTLDGNTAFLNNPDSQNKLIDTLVLLLKGRGDGVDVNFENVQNGLEEQMTRFLTNLSRKLKKANPEYVLTVDLPIYDYYNTYELLKLDPVVDLFLVTGYDYNNGKSRTDGPVAPLDASKGPYTIKRSVNQYLQGGLKREKLLLGLPYYGALWASKQPKPGVWDSTLTFKRHMTYREIKARYCLQKPNYDLENWSGNYVVFNRDSNYYEKCWFDDSLTLSRKYGWVLQEKLAGIGIWALGYDNGYTELWGLIDTMYAADTAVIYKEPYLESKYYRVSRSLTEYRSLIAVAGIFLVVFLMAGMVIALFDWRVREVFFQNKTLRLLYSVAGIAIILSVYAFYLYVSDQPLLNNNNLMALGIGLALGVGITLLVSYYYERKRKVIP